MRLLQRLISLVLAAALLAQAAMAVAIDLSSTMTLTTPNSTYNTLSMTVGLDPLSLGNENETQSPTITGNYSATFNALFNPITFQATIPDITFNEQTPGHISLENETFSGYSWVFGFETETITTTGTS